VIAEAGHVDVLVNNAGVAFMGLTEAFTPEAVARQLDINVVGPLRVNRAILPSMRERKSGFVIYISSVVGRLVFPFNGVYTSSKWALEALAEATSYELRPSGIDVSIVEPGPYKTAIMGVIVGADDEDRKASYGETAAMGDRMMSGLGDVAGDPQEVADAVLALVQAAPGTRPLRKVVAPDPSMVAAVEGINASIEPTQLGLLEAWGLSALLPKKPAAV
jgi:NAD(P)-dependent dehydrogenase (short-subunit alcohol dehydrogenase family)